MNTTATKTTPAHTLKVGDILCSQWGYSMSLVGWYQVVATTPKMVTVHEIHSKIVDGDGARGTSIPVPNAFIIPSYGWQQAEFNRRVIDGYVKINSSEYAKLWDGEPKYHDHWD